MVPAHRKARSEAEFSGWSFSSNTSHISGKSGLLALSRRLSDPYTPGDGQSLPFCVQGSTRSLKPCTCGSALVMGLEMHIPEAVYGSNYLTIKHIQSGLTISFDAEDALRRWAIGSIEQGASLLVPAAQLPVWSELMTTQRARSAADVDWTFCCSDYAGAFQLPTEDASPTAVEGGFRLLGQVTSGVMEPTLAASQHACLPPLPWTTHDGPGFESSGPIGRLLRKREPILWSAEVHASLSKAMRPLVLPPALLADRATHMFAPPPEASSARQARKQQRSRL